MSELTLVQRQEKNMVEILGALDEEPPMAESFTGMIYGPSGSGKTVLAAVLGKVLNGPGEITLIVDTSRGYVSLGNHPTLEGTFRRVPYKHLEQLETLAIMIEREHEALKNVRTVVFDEISKMVRIDTDSISRAKGQDVPEWPDYNTSLNRIRSVLYRIMMRPDVNFIMLAHERDKKNKAGAIIQTHPDFIPSVVKELKEDIHVVGRMTAAAKANPGGEPTYVRMIQSMPTVAIDAKTRLPLPLQCTPDEFVATISHWLQARGKLIEGPEELPKNIDVSIPEELRGNLIDDEPSPDDASPAWVASQ